ncbi:MAG TPA: DivIVA domain-containing protein [Gemmatimonadales bacterium]
MNDEFHLTPIDVRAQEFKRVTFGYDRAGVEDFRERVANEMERLLRDRATLEERVRNLREQLKAFREREKALNDALVAAQQLRNDTEDAARREAELILREARNQADELLAEARESELDVRRDTETSQRHFTAYITSFRALLERHLAEVDALEAHERDGSPPDAG